MLARLTNIFLSAHSEATLFSVEVRFAHFSTKGANLSDSEADLYRKDASKYPNLSTEMSPSDMKV